MTMSDALAIAYQASTWIVPVIIAITFHEAAHGFVAWRLGDDTAYRLGRVTFNPLKHVDRFGTIILPGLLLLIKSPFLFGYAKPVPVRFGNLRNPRRDMVLVAAAGPGINLVLAVISTFLIYATLAMPEGARSWSQQTLFNSLQLNLVLAVFNMLPLPPLDGGRVAVGLLPRALAMPLARLEKWGLLIIIGAIFILPMLGRNAGLDLDIFGWLVGVPVYHLMRGILALAGII
jgi:Zn-dependent protease